MGAKLCWGKEMIAYGDANPQDQMKRNRNGKKVNISNSINMYFVLALFFSQFL